MPDESDSESFPLAREYAKLDALQSLAVGLPGQLHGLILCVDPLTEERVTMVTTDMEYWQMLVDASKTSGLLADMEIPPGRFNLSRGGWPDEWEWKAPRGYKLGGRDR